MGFSITWVAIRDIPLAEAALVLGLAATGQSDEMFDFDVNGITVEDWSIVIYNEPNQSLAEPGRLDALSAGRDVVVVHNIDTVMLQWAERWRNGKEIWSIQHTSEEGPRHLEASGDLPPEFEDVRRERFADQDTEDAGAAAVDHIADIPIELAYRVTGFRHDRTGDKFFELVPVPESKSSSGRSIDRLLGR